MMQVKQKIILTLTLISYFALMQTIKKITNILFLLCTLSIIANHVFSQDKRFVIVKVGFGLPYGAYGGNIEYRWNNLGGYVGAGFMKSQNYRDINLDINLAKTFNTCVGLKYYFLRPIDGLRPVLGIHAGWLNNYYTNKIGSTNYSYNVYGLAAIAGFNFSENIVSLEINILIDPGFAIIKPQTHPYYSDKGYFTPSVGVGVNLYALRLYLKNNKRRKERNEIDTVFVQLNNNITENKKPNPLSQKIAIECNDTLGFKAIKTLFKDSQGKIVAGKQIAENAYIFVRFQKTGAIIGESLQVNYIDSSNKQIEVFVIKTNIKGENIESISGKIKTNNFNNLQYYYTIQGKVTTFYYGNNKNNISIRLNDLKLFDKNKEHNSQLYYDEILICLLSEN